MRCLALLGLGILVLYAPFALAQSVPVIETPAREAFLLDATTGTVLLDKNAEARMPTSSMSKMMTMYMVFNALKEGKLALDTMVTVSERAWKQEGSRMFLDIGTQVKVEDLIRGVTIQSGNDASVALAEAVSGSEWAFADRMNEKAAQLGMTASHFVNATGLPDDNHYATARDLAILGMALQRDFPEHYHFFSEIDFTYHNIKQGNRNPLLYRNIGADGIKTGHAEKAGYGLVGSARRDNRRLVLVVNGLPDMQARADESARLIEWGFREFGYYPLLKAGDQMAEAAVWLGESATVPLAVAEDAAITLARSARPGLKVTAEFTEPVRAPVQKGQQLGTVVISAPGLGEIRKPLIAVADVPKMGFFAATWMKARQVFAGE